MCIMGRKCIVFSTAPKAIESASNNVDLPLPFSPTKKVIDFSKFNSLISLKASIFFK